MNYISNTAQEREQMLEAIKIEKVEELFKAIPDEVLFQKKLNIPEGLSELELLREIKQKATSNTSLDELNSYLGAGAYDHYIPSIIDHLISRSEYYTAYTPYQAELSQGSLQAIYEYQSMICELTGLEVANASLLDGGSAVAEAVLMAARISRKKQILISQAVHPAYRQVAETYGKQQELEFIELKTSKTATDLAELEAKLDNQTAAVVIQYPNFFGTVEELKEIKKIINKEKKVLFIVIANPIALGILAAPGQLGADIVIGEGQSLGNTINYGGPYLGFMASRKKHLRQMPGRIVGATTDAAGEKGYVMTLQTREQHIRREKATSNICTNEALNALVATIYLSLMGGEGLREVAEQSLKKAHYLADRINNLPGYRLINPGPYFHEFLIETSVNTDLLLSKMRAEGILAGLNIAVQGYKNNYLLVCVTEKKSRKELDRFVEALQSVEQEVNNNG